MHLSIAFIGTLPVCCILRKLEQDRKCTYNVTLKSVRAIVFAVEEHRELHITSVCLMYIGPCIVVIVEV